MDSITHAADNLGQPQNRVPCQTVDAPLIDPVDDASAAGDWNVFKRRCAFLDATRVLASQQGIDAKRHYALAYLGQRAQLHGGVYRAARPTVFTDVVVAALNKRNNAARFTRYPWLAQIMALLAALDDAQYNMMDKEANVLAFPEMYAARSGHPQIV